MTLEHSSSPRGAPGSTLLMAPHAVLHVPSPRDTIGGTPLPAPHSPGLGLPADPWARDLDLPLDWKQQPRLWGHAFHAMCSYLGAFPPALAHAFIARYSRPGDVVLDPFSGRGTAPLQACAERRIGAGNDANPLAALLTAAKVDPPSRREAEARLARLHIDWTFESADWLAMAAAPESSVLERPGGGFETIPAAVAAMFDSATLAQLLFLRHRLDRALPVDRFLSAALLGILHGSSRAYVSDAMPNSFSPAPGYAARFVAGRGAPLPRRDAFRLLGARLARLYRDGVPATRGVALEGDARDAGTRLDAVLRERGLPARVRLVVTSPPYLRTIRYGSANWLRLWFLGRDAAAVDSTLDAPRDAAAYARFLRDVLRDLRLVLADDAVVALVVGDVATDLGRPRSDEHRLALVAWEAAAEPEGYRLAGAVSDRIDPRRKLTRLWGPEAGRATRVDRIVLLGASEAGRRRALAGIDTPVGWAPRPRTAAMPLAILGPDAADVPPRRPRVDGSARADEEPGSRADDVAAAQLHPPAAGSPVRA